MVQKSIRLFYIYQKVYRHQSNEFVGRCNKSFQRFHYADERSDYGKASGVYGYTFHNGIDYGAPKGTPVYATAAGKVIISQYKGTYGNYIMVKHTIDGASFTSLYAHLNSRSVSVGQSVSKGQVLGRSAQHVTCSVRIFTSNFTAGRTSTARHLPQAVSIPSTIYKN